MTDATISGLTIQHGNAGSFDWRRLVASKRRPRISTWCRHLQQPRPTDGDEQHHHGNSSSAHLLDDYLADVYTPDVDSTVHYAEWVRSTTGKTDEAEAAALIARDYSIHFHVFTFDTFRAMLVHMRDAIGVPLEIAVPPPPRRVMRSSSIFFANAPSSCPAGRHRPRRHERQRQPRQRRAGGARPQPAGGLCDIGATKRRRAQSAARAATDRAEPRRPPATCSTEK